jgi:hypothetical protein
LIQKSLKLTRRLRLKTLKLAQRLRLKMVKGARTQILKMTNRALKRSQKENLRRMAARRSTPTKLRRWRGRLQLCWSERKQSVASDQASSNRSKSDDR